MTKMEGVAVDRLSDTVHQRVRLGVLALLASESRMAFTALAEALRQSNASLSQHLGVLEQAGYLTLEKGYEGKRPRTWVTITDDGRLAIEAQMRTLRALMDRFDETTGGDRVLAAVFAMAALPDDDQEDSVELRVTPIGLAHAALDTVPDGFVWNVDSPINRFYEWPFVRGSTYRFSGGFEHNQRLFISLGLRAGWHRAWARTEPASNISTQLLELCSAEAAEGFVEDMRADPDYEPALPELDFAYSHVAETKTGAAQYTVWFAVGELVAALMARGPTDEMRVHTVDLATAWRTKLTDVILEPTSAAPRPQ